MYNKGHSGSEIWLWWEFLKFTILILLHGIDLIEEFNCKTQGRTIYELIFELYFKEDKMINE